MADRLAEELVGVGLSRSGRSRLRAAGANYYVRASHGLDAGADKALVRLVTSFASSEEEIERFVNLCKSPKRAQGPP